MKTKILLISWVIFASFLMIPVQPVAAPLEPEDYDIVKYDPENDVIRFRTGGDFKSAIHPNVDILKMTSSFEENNIGTLDDQLVFTMTIDGMIQNSESYKYAFAANIDGDTYVFVAPYKGEAVGFKFGANDLILPPLISASGWNSHKLTIEVSMSQIESHSTGFNFTGGAVYSVGDYERYIDLAPDKLVFITHPSDGSTLSKGEEIRGVIRDSTDGKPGSSVLVKIDEGNWQAATGSANWYYDPGPLTDGEHTIRVKVENADVPNAQDKITILVDSDTVNYKSLTKAPEPHIGDWFEYEAIGDADISGIEIPLSTDTKVEIAGVETIKVDGTTYDVYNLTSHGYGEQDLGYVSFSNTIDKTSWRKLDDYNIVKERTIATNEATLRDTTTTDTTTTYEPPYETHSDFSVTVGYDNSWEEITDAHSESITIVGGDSTTNPPYDEKIHYNGECLYYLPNINVHGNTFYEIYVIRSYFEEDGVSLVEYYSEDLGVPVRIDTYDQSRNLLVSLGLMDYEIKPFSISIEEVTFNPTEPKADSDCKITIKLKNLGSKTAQNIDITVEDGDRTVGSGNIPSIAADGTEELSITWTPKAEGNHTIKIYVSTGNTDLASKTVYILVKPKGEDDGADIMMMLLPILVIIAVVVLLVVLLLRRKGAEKGKAVETIEAEAEAEPQVKAEVAAAAAPVAVAEEAPLTAPAAAQTPPQENTETIKCPSCNQAFSIKYESKPVRVKCPGCGTEGVLN